MHFRLHPLRFSFLAQDSLYFPPGKSANILRGAFGTTLRKIACVPQCPGARACGERVSCPYARMFEPTAIAAGPSGLSDWPRPFVFRATHLNGCTIPAGASFAFDLNLFDMSRPAIAHLVQAFAQLARDGLGPSRGLAQLVDVLHGGRRIYDGQSLLEGNPEPLALPLDSPTERVDRVLVRFLTPTELKIGQELAEQPEFGILASRIRDRLSTLHKLYDDGPLAIDFRGFGERAARVRMTRCELANVDVTRRSSRTSQVHPIGGFVGEAEYQGDLAGFIPYLRAAEWTGVGRQTVWGKGEIRALAYP